MQRRGESQVIRMSVRLSLVALSIVLSACGSISNVPGGPDDPGPGDGGGNSELEASLNSLGVNTTASNRVDPDQQALPEEYTPLGASASFGDVTEFSDDSGANRTDELLLVGLTGDSRFKVVQLDGAQINGDGTIDPGTPETLHTLSQSDSPWAVAEGSGPDYDVGRTHRDVAAGDVDGDGLEELVVVFLDDSSANPVLKVKIVEDQEQGFAAPAEDAFAPVDTDDAGVPDLFDLTVTTGDFDGDGEAQIVVGVSTKDAAQLLFLSSTAGNYEVQSGLTRSFAATSVDGTVTLEMAAGNLDYDSPEELVVVVNEFFPGPAGLSRYFAFDDATNGFEQLKSGDIQGVDGGVHSAVVADVDLGDVDADGIDEVILAGLTRFNMQCSDDPYPYLVVALDDAEHGLTPLDADFVEAAFQNNPCFGAWRVRFVQVNAFDLDGDGIDEIQANQLVFEDLSETGSLVEIHRLPQDVFVEAGSDASAHLTSTSFSITSGDITGDGREDLITYSQFQEDVRVFGKSAIETVGDEGFAQLSSINYGLTYASQSTPRAILTPVNLDMDSPVLKYGDASYRLVFTEPVLVASLAAAPCSNGIGQNVGACETSFGRAESQTISTEVTVSATASVYVGLSAKTNVPFVGDYGADFKTSVGLAAARSSGASYTVTKSEVFTTGSLEDSVVFTSIPYDTYTYQILSHPDPDLLGGTVTVALPREPLLLKVEREFYNEHITGSSSAIDGNVFDHDVGDLSTYPSASRKNDLLNRFGGLENGPQSVGQGTGSTGLELDVSDEVSEGKSLALEFELTVDVTAGPALAGYSVGFGRESSLQITSGESTTYSVTVGDIDASSFGDEQYSYGIFTYVQELDGQELEVINFWVER